MQDPKVHDDSHVDTAILLEQLDRIDTMLDDDLDVARQQLESMQPDLRRVVDEKLCRKLMTYIDDFEIDEAAEIIDEISSILKNPTKG